jgi:hypothetical protein
MDYPSQMVGFNLTNLSIVTPVWVYHTILLQMFQIMPVKFSQLFEISNAPISPVKHHKFRRESSDPSYSKHFLEMVILGLSLIIDIVNPEINRNRCISLNPDQTYQVETIYSLMLLATSMPTNQCKFPRIWSIQC